MRRINTTLTMMLVSMVGIGAPIALAQQGDSPPAQDQPEETPRIVLDRSVHDFGVLFDGDPKQRTIFRFTNEGKGPLIIQNVATTCGCTTPELEKREYAPGESGELVVYYDPHNRKGPQNRTVTIHSNDPISPRKAVTIKSNVKKMIEINPAIVRLGQIPKGESHTMMVDITGRAPGFAVIETVVQRIDGLQVEILDSQIIEESEGESATRFTLLLNLNDAQKIGPFQGALSVTMTNAAGEVTNKNISIIGEVLGDLKVSPRQFNVGPMPAGGTMVRNFSMVSRDSKPFKILRVEERPLMGIDNKPRPMQFQNIEFEAVAEKPEYPDRYMVRFSFKPRPEIVRQFFTQLVFFTDRKDEPEIVMRVLGRINNPTLVVPQTGTKPVGTTPAGTNDGG